MTSLLWAVIGILGAVILILLVKIHLLHQGAREIADAFSDRLSTDTNTLISPSTRDRELLRLADSLNKQLRLLRRQRHRYLTGDRELKEAVTNISHDLRTPLTALCGYLDLLEREEKTAAAERYLSLIQNRVSALKQMTEELFRYSVILSTQDDMTLEAVHVNGVLEECIAGFYAALTQRGITPVLHITQTRIERQLNKAALFRVFNNILNNALKYSDGDLEISLLENGEIVFSNTASGLDGVQAGKLFDRFYSVETAKNSTGLGLSIAKLLTEHMKGEIYAEYSDPTFKIHVYFP